MILNKGLPFFVILLQLLNQNPDSAGAVLGEFSNLVHILGQKVGVGQTEGLDFLEDDSQHCLVSLGQVGHKVLHAELGLVL